MNLSPILILTTIFASAKLLAEQKIKVNTNALDAILSANIIVQLTLLILVFLSVFSWMIIIAKKKQFQKVEQANLPFLDTFWNAESLDQINEDIEQYSGGTLYEIFKSGYNELQKIAGSKLATEETSKLNLSGIDNLERALRKSIDSQVAILESRLSFLATTGSTGPFIGLFGTVWGIMGAFQKIAQTNTANLAVVAPGISEALIATAIGLAAAIPATVGYNSYITKLRQQELDMNNFATDFLNITRRNFFKED